MAKTLAHPSKPASRKPFWCRSCRYGVATASGLCGKCEQIEAWRYECGCRIDRRGEYVRYRCRRHQRPLVVGK